MAAIKSKNTAPEVLLKSELRKLGLRFSAHPESVIGKPDVCFKKFKIAIFCDGDFWHGRYWNTPRQSVFKVRKDFWLNKIEGNIARDKFINKELKSLGWVVIRVWETDLKKNPSIIIKKIINKIYLAKARSKA